MAEKKWWHQHHPALQSSSLWPHQNGNPPFSMPASSSPLCPQTSYSLPSPQTRSPGNQFNSAVCRGLGEQGFGIFLCGCVWSCCLVTKPCPTLLWAHGLLPTRLLCTWDFVGKNTGVGCHLLLQGIFLIQGSNSHLLCLLYQQVDSLPLCHLGSPSAAHTVPQIS